MNIDQMISVLQTFKAQGAQRVLLSVDDVSPPEPFTMFYTPLYHTDVVYLVSKQGDGVQSKDAPTIVDFHQLQGLELNGRDCEVCGHSMVVHAWAALDNNGFAVNCSIEQAKYEKQLIAAGAIKRRALVVTAQDLEAYE